MLRVNGVSKSFGVRELFRDVTFRLDEGEKAALVGANGSGKTTLLSIIEGGDMPDEGDVSKSKLTVTSVMAQELNTDETALNTALSVFEPLFAMEDELERITKELLGEPPERERLINRQHTLRERYEDAGGLTCRARARSSLMALGLSEAEITLPLGNLSGGQQAKVRLCMALLSAPSLLLLDEPTNHLDLAAIEWLEGFLKASPLALIVVSHDRYFLDRVTTRTLELEDGKLFDYPVPYTEHLTRRSERRESERRVFEGVSKEIERQYGIVEQQRRYNRERNIRMAESRLKVIAKLEKELVKPSSDPESMKLSFPVEIESGDDVLMAQGLGKAFGEKRLFRDVSLHMRKGERLCMVGGNGVGKTTLLRIIQGSLAADSGVVRLGTNVRLGVYEQGQASLVPTRTAIDEVHASCPSLTHGAVRNAMAAFLFRGDDVFKLVSMLSGGEKARVALLKLIFSGANFLILDEPTNHLDSASREALENALSDYEGTILAVSHDRYFIEKIAGRVGLLTKDGLALYSDLAHVPRERQLSGAPQRRNNDYARRKERESLQRRLSGRAERAEGEIERLEDEIESLEAQLMKAGSDFESALKLSAALEAAKTALDAAYAEWLENNENLEEFTD